MGCSDLQSEMIIGVSKYVYNEIYIHVTTHLIDEILRACSGVCSARKIANFTSRESFMSSMSTQLGTLIFRTYVVIGLNPKTFSAYNFTGLGACHSDLYECGCANGTESFKLNETYAAIHRCPYYQNKWRCCMKDDWKPLNNLTFVNPNSTCERNVNVSFHCRLRK